MALEEFEKIWGARYPLVVQFWQRSWGEIATFFKYPPEIRKIIYTTNMIESYHRQLRKVTKGKVFPTDEALLKMLYLVTQENGQDGYITGDKSCSSFPFSFPTGSELILSEGGISTLLLTDP